MFQFFNKPGQKGQGSRRTPQATTAQDEEARAVNADWGDQQVCKLRVLECLDGMVVLYVLLPMSLALVQFGDKNRSCMWGLKNPTMQHSLHGHKHCDGPQHTDFCTTCSWFQVWCAKLSQYHSTYVSQGCSKVCLPQNKVKGVVLFGLACACF